MLCGLAPWASFRVLGEIVSAEDCELFSKKLTSTFYVFCSRKRGRFRTRSENAKGLERCHDYLSNL
jgi:hypothetical protein